MSDNHPKHPFLRRRTAVANPTNEDHQLALNWWKASRSRVRSKIPSRDGTETRIAVSGYSLSEQTWKILHFCRNRKLHAETRIGIRTPEMSARSLNNHYTFYDRTLGCTSLMIIDYIHFCMLIVQHKFQMKTLPVVCTMKLTMRV